MNKRIDIAKVQPKALSAMLTIENYLAETKLAEAMMQIIMINSWNRFALATKMKH